MTKIFFRNIKLNILISIIISFFISSFLTKDLFVAYTPILKMPLDQYLLSKINKALYFVKNQDKQQNFSDKKSIYSGLSESTLKNMKEVVYSPLKKISNGIYAQQKENVINIVFKEEEIEWVEYNLVVNGKKRKIKIPKDQSLPDENRLKEIFKD